MILFFLPETLRRSTKSSNDGEKKTFMAVNPLKALLLLKYPNVLLAVLYLGIMYVKEWKIVKEKDVQADGIPLVWR